MDGKYENILNRPWRGREQGLPMARGARAAQFAPFAALTGFEAVLAETARRTEGEVTLSEEAVAQINSQLQWLREHLAEMPKIHLTFFVPDGRKEGGSYREFLGKILRIDEYGQKIWLETGQAVEFRQIIKLSLP